MAPIRKTFPSTINHFTALFVIKLGSINAVWCI